jgi:Interferon-induced transmembrane protein
MSTPPPIFTPNQSASNENVPNRLVWAIVSSFFSLCFCCGFPGLITGIAAMVFSNKVNVALRGGDIDAAKQASKTAMILCWVTTAFAVLGLLNIVYTVSSGNFEQQMQQVQEAIRAAQSQ